MTSSSRGRPSTEPPLRLRLAVATAGLWLLGWLCTGTLAAYAVGLDLAQLWQPCRYLVNCDHAHFLWSFQMLDGWPRTIWHHSVVLRRTLYPLLAYPWMKVLDFEHGGLLTNFLLAAAALVGFTVYVARKVGDRAATAAALLLATYPGVHYWIGLPYCYAIIVPCSLGAAVALRELQDEERPRRIALLAGALGVLYLGYDLAAFFALPALALVWLRTRRPALVLLALAAQALPSAVNGAVLTYGLGVPVSNSNTEIYAAVLRAWLHPGPLAAWGALLGRAPYLLLHDFLAANFVWLPALFVAAWLVARVRGTTRLERFEVALLLSALAVWAFNNLAPPYPGKWQVRGEWIARLYQPVFPVFLTFVARFVEEAAGEGGWLRGARGRLVLAAAALNALVMVGPFVGATSYTGRVWKEFYAHAPPNSSYGRDPVAVMAEHLDALGRRPLGFCAQPRPNRR